MKCGTYGNSNNDFRKLALRKFCPSLFDRILYLNCGCGSSALALLTGKDPNLIVQQNKGKEHYSDRFMVDYLRKNQFKVYQINKCNLSSRNKSDTVAYSINEDNLILSSHLIQRNVASWIVTYGDTQFHNFQLSKCSFMGLLNFPISTAYVLYKKEWGIDNDCPRI